MLNPRPVPPPPAGAARIRPEEALEDPSGNLGLQPGAVVRYLDDDLVATLPCGRYVHGYRSRRVLSALPTRFPYT